MSLNSGQRRVVVTGLGAVSPLGLDVPSTWQGMVEGRSGADFITLFDASDHDTKFACEVKNFEATNFMDRKEARRTDRFVQLAIAAALEAVNDSGLAINENNAERVGVVVGSGVGGLGVLTEQFRVLFDRGPSRVSPFLVPMFIIDMAAGQVSIRLGARGPNWAAVSACASSGDAIGESMEIIRRGDADVMVAGGTEAAIVPIGVAGFNAARAMSTNNEDPRRASRPFDAKRDGFVMGEGAALLILEDLEHAQARGARIYCELAGYGASADAYHITLPCEDGAGAASSMRRAIEKSGLRPDEIDYINAHGTSTPAGDRIETLAIHQVFGEHASKLAVSSTKSMTGHLLGAAGAIEALASILAIQEGIIPPTINYEYPDPECDLDYVPNESRRRPVRVALSNAFGFGGHNATLIFRKLEG